MKFLEHLAQQFAGKPIDWDELEESLIRTDLGVPMTTRIIKTLQEREAWSLLGIGDVIKAVREEIERVLPPDPMPIRQAKGKPTVILIVGVNGTGKTTSTAKLAHYLRVGAIDRKRPRQVMLAAADTFRAAAIEQLDIWAKRLGLEMIRGQYGADPAALCYEAYQTATTRKIDFLLCDTAGRQHTKTNLIADLQKVKRTPGKLVPVATDETLLVVGATTGGNALTHAREFDRALAFTALIATKIYRSGKAGILPS